MATRCPSDLETITETVVMLPCVMCDVYLVTEEVHLEEGGMCLACSDDYYSHDHEDCSWYCMMVEFPAECRRKRMEEKQ